jgi:arylformamidase
MIWSKITDLTLPFKEGMKGYSRNISKTLNKDGWNASILHLYSHAGTHMDAPFHFGLSDVTIDDMLLTDFIAESIVVKIAKVQPGMLLSTTHVKHIPQPTLQGKGVLFHTGWSRYSNDIDIYRNKLPRISEELAIYLVNAGVKLIGVEPPSVADVNNKEELTAIHTILLKNNITIVEGLTNLEKITREWFTFIALPLKIENGDGCPVRALALEN